MYEICIFKFIGVIVYFWIVLNVIYNCMMVMEMWIFIVKVNKNILKYDLGNGK